MQVLSRIFLVSFCLVLTACMVGPDYQRPQPPLTTQWQTPLPHGGDTSQLTNWWRQFDDPTLAELIALAEHDSPTLAQAIARIEQSRADLDATQGALFPYISSTTRGSVSRSEEVPGASRLKLANSTLDARWELDLFGGIRRQREEAQARLDGIEFAWHDARVSLAAEIALEYLNLRACEAQLADAEEDLASRRTTERLTQFKTKAGFSAPGDFALAQASAADGLVGVLALRRECELVIKTLVELTGETESALRPRLALHYAQLPQPTALHVTAVPAEVIRQRPDLAAAERALAAASAATGVAEAARYPNLSLTGSIGRTYTTSAGISQAFGSWSFGPTLSLPLFDAGIRAANARAAQARYAESLAAYQGKVRQAVREVEQSLVRLADASAREQAGAQAEEGFAASLRAAEERWQAGFGSQLDLEDSRRLWVNARTQHLNVRRDNIAAWIGLYRALGGGWVPATDIPNLASH